MSRWKRFQFLLPQCRYENVFRVARHFFILWKRFQKNFFSVLLYHKISILSIECKRFHTPNPCCNNVMKTFSGLLLPQWKFFWKRFHENGRRKFSFTMKTLSLNVSAYIVAAAPENKNVSAFTAAASENVFMKTLSREIFCKRFHLTGRNFGCMKTFSTWQKP